MTAATIVLAGGSGEHLVPDEHVLSMIQNCAAQIETAATIPDVKRVLLQAEAIYAVTQKIKAAERIKRGALRLLVDAETQLGRLTKQLPQGKKGAGAIPGQQTKRKLLAEFGINRYRCSVAEMYADAPKGALDAALGKSRTLNEVSVNLGFKNPYRDGTPEKISRDLDFLANEAIELLERCIARQQVPHAGTVVEFRDRLSRLRVRS